MATKRKGSISVVPKTQMYDENGKLMEDVPALPDASRTVLTRKFSNSKLPDIAKGRSATMSLPENVRISSKAASILGESHIAGAKAVSNFFAVFVVKSSFYFA